MTDADTDDPAREWPTRAEQETLMGERNPETWNPEPDPDYHKSGTVNIWDPIEGEGFSEPGHWAHRMPDMDTDHARRLALRGEFDDLGEHQPLPLLSSDMRGVPTEGVQGSYSHVVDLRGRDGDGDPCPECGQPWGVYTCLTMPGEHTERCLICEAKLGGSL